MSDIPNSNIPVVDSAVESTHNTTSPHALTTAEETPNVAAPIGEESTPKANGLAAASPVEDLKTEMAPAAVGHDSLEPVTEGLLGYKGPGLLKSLVPTKKEFWLSDAPVTPQHMSSYMRGEKPETSNAVVAWASQTGKGLLFFNKKGDTSRTSPASVLPMYDATNLHKPSPHEISFEIHSHKHTLKAANDTEAESWFQSLEKTVELGKAQKESIRAGEGYKAEMEKLNKPNTIGHSAVGGAAAGGASVGGVAAAAAHRGQSKPKKSTDLAEHPVRTGSSDDEVVKKNKSRSTSRGMLGRLTGKKDELEAKREEKKEVKAIEKEEKKEEKAEKKDEKAEIKAEKAAEKHGDAGLPVIPGAAALDAPSTAERVVAAPLITSHEPVAESSALGTTTDAFADKPKNNKRMSILGRMQSGLQSLKSPTKEKDLKDAELKPEVPPKDTGVSETAPQLPEPIAAEHAPAEATTASPIAAAAPPAIETTEPTSTSVHESKPAEAAKEQLDTVAPNKEKAGFLSGLPFIGKRNRSVSPSNNVKEASATSPVVPHDESPIAPSKDVSPVEPLTKPEEPFAETSAPVHSLSTAETPATTESAEKPIDGFAEPAKTDGTAVNTTTPNKRGSVFGGFSSLGRRASKALNRSPASKKENTLPGTTTAEPQIDSVASVVDDKLDGGAESSVNGESKVLDSELPKTSTINDVVPDAVHAGEARESTPVVTASA